jgi:hypothetical protein
MSDVTGYKVESTKNITSITANFLITQLIEPATSQGKPELSSHGRWLIEEAEKLARA